VNLRTKLSLLLSILLALSIGATGAILIYESSVHERDELRAKHQLLAENRAFALRDNFLILENELARLAQRPQINLADNDPLPERQLLDSAHQHSVLYNTAVLLLAPSGECVGAVPADSSYRHLNFADRPWFVAARSDSRGPQFFPTEEPGTGRTLKIVQPITRSGVFGGALVGIITLGQDNLITPALRDNLPPETLAILVDREGHVVFPTDAGAAAPASSWERAIHAATHGSSGTLRGHGDGHDSLFAYAAVGAATGYSVVFRWPWSNLTANLRQQVGALFATVMFGIALATLFGVAIATYVTGPLKALGETASRIARGEYPRPGELAGQGGSDELGAFMRAFRHMGESLQKRDIELSQAAALLEERVAERTRELEHAQKQLLEVERLATMGKTSAAIAHELKNAMGGLGMAVDLILQDPSNETRVARLRTQVVAEIARLRDVTDSLLSFSRAPRLDQSIEDLHALARRAVSALGDVIADRGATVEVHDGAAVPVRCDGHKMQSVVMNLVKNAVEAGRRVEVRAHRINGEAVVEIADDGPGLSQEAESHLFEPFFTTKPNGTGLGLPTSRRFVEAHGGRIETAAAGELGGALFRVCIPATAGEDMKNEGERS
jgi:signal transduction histidine kinase